MTVRLFVWVNHGKQPNLEQILLPGVPRKNETVRIDWRNLYHWRIYVLETPYRSCILVEELQVFEERKRFVEKKLSFVKTVSCSFMILKVALVADSATTWCQRNNQKNPNIFCSDIHRETQPKQDKNGPCIRNQEQTTIRTSLHQTLVKHRKTPIHSALSAFVKDGSKRESTKQRHRDIACVDATSIHEREESEPSKNTWHVPQPSEHKSQWSCATETVETKWLDGVFRSKPDVDCEYTARFNSGNDPKALDHKEWKVRPQKVRIWLWQPIK